jgi:hypothetical protein
VLSAVSVTSDGGTALFVTAGRRLDALDRRLHASRFPICAIFPETASAIERAAVWLPLIARKADVMQV